jgi:DNA-binding response OmpR family regulator
MEKNKIQVLLAEDDHNLGSILKTFLDAKGYSTTLCVNGLDALETYREKNNFDFCIVDVMMPVKDGFTLAKDIRKENKKIPILFLTAKSMLEDKQKGFELGADDYLTKPFNMDELLMRMQAIIRRSGIKNRDKAQNIFKLGTYTFDYNRQLLTRENFEQKLTSKESDLLELLCENLNEVVERSFALNKIWRDDSYFNARSMDVYIAKLRKYLKDDENVELINVHGIGFRLFVNE